MDNFDFWCGTKIIFGKNTEEKVGREVAGYSKKILLHYGGGSIKKSGLYAKVVSLLNDEKIEVFELSGVVPNPRLSLVRKGIDICRKEGIDFILAVGGGSVIDSAKAIAVGVPSNRDVWDFFLTDSVKPKEALPIGTILTIPAAGSEASFATVITNEENSRKLSFKSDIIRPKFSILNPEYTKTLPPEQTAYGIVDMLGHIIERYFTNTKNVDLTDKLCESTMRSIIKNAKLVMENPENYDYRAELMWASTVAHCGLLGTGRQEDWATHLLEHELSAIYDVAHGAGLAVLYPAWMKFVYKNDVRRFAQFAEEVWGIREGSDEEKALEGIEALRGFYKNLGVATTLKELNIDDSKFEEMANAMVARWKTAGSFVKIGKKETLKIYRIALG
ncbi:MAG: iron-containing alcohol dehydrogenase [Candidatus Aenigmarchaeota archaeon]|nr:iron-containing alcohol dehydrogenase [Candidatus Aenigmarchaeota archaeon]